MCAYDAQRAYMPTTFVLAGSPLHATAMSVSPDGRLLAVAALPLRPGSTGPPRQQLAGPAGGKCGASAPAAGMGQPAIVLHSTLSMEPLLHVPVECGSHVEQVQLLPDGRHVLALTASGRLLGYSCSDGSLEVDVPRCLTSPCTALVLDPTGSFLVAGTASGQLKVWGLHALHTLPPSMDVPSDDSGSSQPLKQQPAEPAVVCGLPSQELAAPASSSVQGAAFLDGRRLLTAGSAGEVCCWSFSGEPCCAPSTGGQPGDVSTRGKLVVQRPGEGVGWAASQVANHPQPLAATKQPEASSVGCLLAACSSSWPATAAPRGLLSKGQQRPALKEPNTRAFSRPVSPAPRKVPAALQTCVPQRPPSAPDPLPRLHQDAPTAIIAAAADRLQCARPPGTVQRGQRKQPPIRERYEKEPEASLVVTATPDKRCTRVVRQERRLRVTSPAKQRDRSSPGGTKRGPAAQRSAAWVDAESEQDSVPSYRPSQQLQLLPPSAAVRRVLGFEAAAGFCWLPGGPSRELLYTAGNVLVADDMPAGQQRHLARLPRNVSALAATADGRLAAVAACPAAGDGGTADIHLVQLHGRAQGAELPVLRHHSHAVQVKGTQGMLCVQLPVADASETS